jgi:hypothetical protein
VKYCQKRLGGKLQDKNGNPFDENLEKKKLSELLNRMKVKGVKGGKYEDLVRF